MTGNGDADATLSQNPTADAVFVMDGPGNFSALVSWESGGVAKSAIPRPGSAQELFTRLAVAAGLDDDVVNLGYNADAKSLTFRLHPTAPINPAEVSVDANIGDLLRNTTNLSALKQATGSLEADVDDIDFDLTFGVLLLPNTSDITPLRGSATGGLRAPRSRTRRRTSRTATNDPSLGQVVTKTGTNPLQTCTISAITDTTLTCALSNSGAWASGDDYDVDGGLIDRFYVKVDDTEPELSVGGLSLERERDPEGQGRLPRGRGRRRRRQEHRQPGRGLLHRLRRRRHSVLAVDIAAPHAFNIVQGGSRRRSTMPSASASCSPTSTPTM